MRKTPIRYQLKIFGAVQGIGFRPFLHRLAHQYDLRGWVSNIPQGVVLEIEGSEDSVDIFKSKIQTEKPSLAIVHSIEETILDPIGYTTFEIRASINEGKKQAIILPDITTCPECTREMFDPANRRYRYPFINCTHCGPRLTIIESLPYDRKHTSMMQFTMCPDCQKEYTDPFDRRFHAQPNACPVCGPQIQMVDRSGVLLSEGDESLRQAVKLLREGKILAVKGIGGFHLMADPFNDDTVQQLRKRKHREEKPFALMMPSISGAKQYCNISVLEEKVLCSPHSPIVLVHKSSVENRLSRLIAPHNPLLGILLPYSPLHHLLMHELQQPMIATSGNISDEPICIDNNDAIQRLGSIADYFLIHNRPIVRHADDSIIRIIGGREVVFRRARGLAPLPIQLNELPSRTILAVGGHLKNTIAINVDQSVFISQHIGDLETEQSFNAFQSTIDDFQTMYETHPDIVAADKHPEYLSTKHALSMNVPVIQIQHHAAHIFSCMAENQLTNNVFGVSWDGTGYGDDGKIWGGEFFSFVNSSMAHVGTFRSFPLPGGSAAIKEPRRAALGLLFELSHGNIERYNDLPLMKHFTEQERTAVVQAMRQNINSPRTTSIGRLFDAVSSLIDLRHTIGYEGQAALELESLTEKNSSGDSYRFFIRKQPNDKAVWEIDWEEMILGIIEEMRGGIASDIIARKFHHTLSEMIISMAKRFSISSVALSGGCFQNAYLSEYTIQRLNEEGFNPYWHQRVPPNDGGISLGQLYGTMLLQQFTMSRAHEQEIALV